MSLVFFVAKLNQNAICFWGLPPLQRVFSNLKKKHRQKSSVFGLGSPDLEDYKN
jgi:hypothetical protein